MVCLDTEVLVGFLRGDKEAASLMSKIASEMGAASTTAVNAYELMKGALISGRPGPNLKRVSQLLDGLEVLPLTSGGCRRAAEIHAELRSKGRSIGEFDVLIAGIVMERGESLVSRDGDFSAVRGLDTRRW